MACHNIGTAVTEGVRAVGWSSGGNRVGVFGEEEWRGWERGNLSEINTGIVSGG